MTTETKPPSLDIDFCIGCDYPATGKCDGCIRAHLNEVQDYDEDWRDNHSLTTR